MSRIRGPWVKMALVLVAAVVGVHLIGGWYFSGQIGSEVVNVSHQAIPPNLSWVSTGPDSVRLEALVPGTVLPREAALDAVYGLSGSGPRLVVADVLGGSGQTVERRVATRDGGEYWNAGGLPTGPGLRRNSEPVAGSLARDVWEDPSQVGLVYREVAVPGPLGPMPAWVVPGGSGARTTWAVMVHGRGATRSEPLRALISAHAIGMPALVTTYRNDVGAPRSPEGTYAFGVTEWEDLQASVQYALDRGATDIVLYGFSMGGGIVASFMSNSDLAVDVSALVLEAPMLDIGETIAYGASQTSIPLLGLPIPATLTWTAEELAKLRYGSTWEGARYLADTSWVTVPTLVIHGDADTTVPLATSQQLADAAPRDVSLHVVPGAEHVESWNLDPVGYADTVDQFLTDQVSCARQHPWCR